MAFAFAFAFLVVIPQGLQLLLPLSLPLPLQLLLPLSLPLPFWLSFRAQRGTCFSLAQRAPVLAFPKSYRANDDTGTPRLQPRVS